MEDWVAENYGIIIPGGVIEYVLGKRPNIRYVRERARNGFDDCIVALDGARTCTPGRTAAVRQGHRCYQ